MKNLIIYFLILSKFSILAQAQTATTAEKAGEKREYTKEEFEKAVFEELDKRMKKTGRTKLLDFSKELLQKEQDLISKEEELKKKEEQLKIAEEDLKKRYVDFKASQENFLACIDKDDQDQKNRITHMVNVVSSMRPQTAADLLSQQDPSLSVKILGMLDAVKVSKIFNLMDKEISARLQKQYMTMKK